MHGLPYADTRLERRQLVFQVGVTTYDEQILIHIARDNVSVDSAGSHSFVRINCL